ncbi:uncharacterized protein [Arachis hypogaea]|uniref:uncharacterized protein n=1 Tax=Arachis hypogaea TaxID=3818 RepID=UPI003B22749F
MKCNLIPRKSHINNNHLIRWYLLSEGVIKINVDGSFFSHINNASCGGVIRHHLGKFIKAFSCNLGSCSIMHAKLWAIIKALQIVISENFRDIVIESNSLMAINFIKDGSPPHHPCAALLEDVHNMVNRIHLVHWNHTLREAKSVVDILTKKGHTLPFGLHTFELAPSGIIQALSFDSFGSLRLR